MYGVMLQIAYFHTLFKNILDPFAGGLLNCFNNYYLCSSINYSAYVHSTLLTLASFTKIICETRYISKKCSESAIFPNVLRQKCYYATANVLWGNPEYFSHAMKKIQRKKM